VLDPPDVIRSKENHGRTRGENELIGFIALRGDLDGKIRSRNRAGKCLSRYGEISSEMAFIPAAIIAGILRTNVTS